MTATCLPNPPFSAKEWQSRAWLARLEAWVLRYLRRDMHPWQKELIHTYFSPDVIRNTVEQLRIPPQPLPSTFRSFPEHTEGFHPDAAAAQRYIANRYATKLDGIQPGEHYVGYAAPQNPRYFDGPERLPSWEELRGKRRG